MPQDFSVQDVPARQEAQSAQFNFAFLDGQLFQQDPTKSAFEGRTGQPPKVSRRIFDNGQIVPYILAG